MRISRDEWGLRLAEVTALRGTCVRRKVGCVLTDSAGRVLATGYNGVARGVAHCNEGESCGGSEYGVGEGLDACEAVHAEANAVIQCRNVDAIHTCYVTVSPCIPCLKLFMNTGCRRIVFRESYAREANAKRLWLRGETKSIMYDWVKYDRHDS